MTRSNGRPKAKREFISFAESSMLTSLVL